MSIPHISVCVCTYKRAALLPDLLSKLERQRTDGLFTYDVVIADNDAARSAEQIVRSIAGQSRTRMSYCVEPRANIALARNAAVTNASGNLLVFIDDDELPIDDWLYLLFRTLVDYEVEGVLGPVIPQFQQAPAEWVKKGRFFDRPRYGTGHVIKWTEARTGNVLLKREILDCAQPFRAQFATAGEDVDLFRRLMEKGCRFVWCDTAAVFELVPPSRCTRRFLLRRALLRGSNFPKHPTHRLRNTLKSLIAVPCYTVLLPILALAGHHLFVAYLIKILDHASRLLAFAGLKVLQERET